MRSRASQPARSTSTTTPRTAISLAAEVISEWLRIRSEERLLNQLQAPAPVDAVIKTDADEYETKVDDVETIRKLLEALDFRPLITVDKTREEWKTARDRDRVRSRRQRRELCEYEFKADTADVKEIDRGYTGIWTVDTKCAL